MPDGDSQEAHVKKLRHSAAHLLAAAVLDLWPDSRPAIGPATDTGFYYDFEFSRPPAAEDLNKIEVKMRELLLTWAEFSRREVTADEATKLFPDNPYKQELIKDIAARGEPITLYTAGGFTDLCRGGHVTRPSHELKHFALLSIAGAYWRGDSTKPMLSRIYGTAFPSAKALAEFLERQAEATRRDHRLLGQTLDLFSFSPLVGSGLPLFTPRGAIIREALIAYIRSLQAPHGYQPVWTPHLAKPDLYHTSGHWDKFREHLFHVKGAHDEFVVKPMNCPHHTQLYLARPRSYRELPVRYAEIATVYRDEASGELLGLTRVRAITQDDGHVFCRPDQLQGEVETILTIAQQFFAAFDLTLAFRLSLWDPKRPADYLGSAPEWEKAQQMLREALRARQLKFTEALGEAAFYGPKLDFLVRDSLERTWQLATVQVDFNMPQRFGLTYTDSYGREQTPVMIHRAIAGSLERFVALLLEHYAGHLPLWLSPIQVIVLPVSDEVNEYAHSVATQLEGASIRVAVDDRSLTIAKKVREAELKKVPLIAVVGTKEMARRTVTVRARPAAEPQLMAVSKFVPWVQAQIANKRTKSAAEPWASD